MIRNLKALGLALAAVLALGVVTASSASAQKLTAPAAGVTLTGTQTGAVKDNALTLTGNTTVCANATYTGHKVATTPHVNVPNLATEITITPKYGSCITETAVGNMPTTIDMTGCDYTFKLGATTGGVNGTYGVTAGVVCPAGANIHITIATTSHNTVWCDVTIEHEPGHIYTGLHATSTGGGVIDIAGTIENFKSISTNVGNSTGVHPNFLPCSGTHKPGANPPVLHIDVSTKGHLNEAISISHP